MNTILKYSIPLLIGSAAPSAWSACVTQPAPDNSIVANAAGDTCTNNVNISTTATDLAGFGMSDTPLGVAVNSVTLINSSSGTITTTGAGATGIHSEGANAIIINNGTISVSGGATGSYYADGINALGNNSTVINSGSIVASADEMFGVWFGASSGGLFQ